MNYTFNQEAQGSFAVYCLYCHVQLNILLVISIKFTLNLYWQTILSKSLCHFLDKENIFSSGYVTMKLVSRVKTIPDNTRRVLSSLSVQKSMTVLHWKPPVLIKISAVKTVHMTESSSFLVQVSSLILLKWHSHTLIKFPPARQIIGWGFSFLGYFHSD